MVEGYRHEAGENLLELPSGFIEENEEPSQAAKRELLEETKHNCDSLELVNWFIHGLGGLHRKIMYLWLKG